MADEDQEMTEDNESSGNRRWKVQSVVHKDLHGNVINEQQYNQMANQARQLAQQHAQQAAQQRLFKQHPELLAKIMEKQQEQDIKDRSFEKTFTFQQKREYAKRETGHRLVQSSPNFSQEEKIAENREWELYQGGLTLPTVMKNKVYPKGREPGSIWNDPQTDEQYIIDENGTPKLGAKFNSSKAGQLITQKHEIDKHNLLVKDRQHDAIMKFRADNLFIKGKDRFGNETITPRSKEDLDMLTQSWLGHEEKKQNQPKKSAIKSMNAPKPSGQPVHIRSKEEYDSAPSGIRFIAPDGSMWEKP